ncbi:MAG: type IX secretion system membrane protein PorP/SprF, partial [Flavobacteriales bacterium]
MKRILIILCSLILCGSQQLSAQQQPIFSSYLLNPFFYNPAVSGSENI